MSLRSAGWFQDTRLTMSLLCSRLWKAPVAPRGRAHTLYPPAHGVLATWLPLHTAASAALPAVPPSPASLPSILPAPAVLPGLCPGLMAWWPWRRALASLYIAGQHLLPSGAAGGGWHLGRGLLVNPGQVCPLCRQDGFVTVWKVLRSGPSPGWVLGVSGCSYHRVVILHCEPWARTRPASQCSVCACVSNGRWKDRGGHDTCVRRAGTEALQRSRLVMPTAPRCPVGMVTGQPGTRVGGGGGGGQGLPAKTGRPWQAFCLTAPSVWTLQEGRSHRHRHSPSRARAFAQLWLCCFVFWLMAGWNKLHFWCSTFRFFFFRLFISR